jgi:hypothetical protein
METKYYLYIKTSPFGLKYLGKTTKNPFTYLGSGKIWKRHIAKHSLTFENIETEVVFETDDINQLIKKGIELSLLYNIVESKEWANLREERGDGGDTSKFIDFSNPIFHNPERSKHLNSFIDEEDKKQKLKERASKIDYKNPERIRKIKENTDWEEKEKKRLENTDYSTFLWKTHEKNKKPVLQFDMDGNFLNEFDCAANAARSLGFSNGGNITNCCKGRCKSSMGYIWKYKDKNESN